MEQREIRVASIDNEAYSVLAAWPEQRGLIMLPTDTAEPFPFPWSPLTRKTLNGVNDRDLAYNGGGFFLSFFLFWGKKEGSRSFQIPSARAFFRYALVSRYLFIFFAMQAIEGVKLNYSARLKINFLDRFVDEERCLEEIVIILGIIKFFDKFKIHEDFLLRFRIPPSSLDDPRSMRSTFNLELTFQRRVYKQE